MGACWLFPLQVLGILALIQWVCRCSGWCWVMDFSVVVVAHVQPRSLVMGVEVARDSSWRLGGSSPQLETAAAAQGTAVTSDRSCSLSCCLQHHIGRKAVMVGPPLPPRSPPHSGAWPLRRLGILPQRPWGVVTPACIPSCCVHTAPRPLPRPALRGCRALWSGAVSTDRLSRPVCADRYRPDRVLR